MPSASPADDRTLVPDLLHATPRRRIDVEETDEALFFAWAGSRSGGLFVEVLDRATVVPSTWDPSGFVDDLFVNAFVRGCFEIELDGRRPVVAMRHLVRVLAAPPPDRTSIDLRRGIMAELLGSEAHRDALGRLYQRLRRFRVLVEGSTAADSWDPNRRQLELLARFRDVVETMAEGFADATSALSRLARFAERVRASEPYRSLVDLLDYDQHLATVSLRMRVGADGRVRSLEIDDVRENDDNPFVHRPARRWRTKLELLARGFRFSDQEVMARYLDAVFEGVRPEWVALVQLFGDVELYLGTLGFVAQARRAGLEVCLPELVEPTAPRRVEGLFNPLLLATGVAPVPCAVHTDRHPATVLLTGPNSGGKTRLLQSLGLAQLLAQSGLVVPARHAEMSLASGLLVSLIQTTTADQTEGRLGIELKRIRSLFERLPAGAMVILDELCSGTNPSEGEEIFELVLQMLSRLQPQAFISTHFLRFATRLERDRPLDELRFLQVELGADDEPTYQFVEGVASTSLAGRAAARLGVTGEQLSSLIDRRLSETVH